MTDSHIILSSTLCLQGRGGVESSVPTDTKQGVLPGTHSGVKPNPLRTPWYCTVLFRKSLGRKNQATTIRGRTDDGIDNKCISIFVWPSTTVGCKRGE